MSSISWFVGRWPQPAFERRRDCLARASVCILVAIDATTNVERSREVSMKRWLVGLIVLFSPSAFAQQPAEIPYDSVANLLKLPPDMHLGEAAGVAVNSKGHIFVYSRGGSSPGLRQYRGTDPGMRPKRHLPARDRQEPLRLGLRAHRAHRQGRQHLGDR